MARLSFGILTPKEDCSIHNLYNLLTRGQLSSRFLFPDTGFITTKIQEQFWEFPSNTTIAFSQMTVAELSGWIEHPIHNVHLHNWLPRAFEQCASSESMNGPLMRATTLGVICGSLHQFNVAVLTRALMQSYGYEHYVSLLSVRKRVGIRVANELSTEMQREPTDEEVRNRLHHICHPRVSPIAFKGWKDRGKRNYMADEELVVSAVVNASMTGQTTTILTRDTDVFEQFTKLCEMVTADYKCFRFGEVRFYNPDGMPMGEIPIPPTSMKEHGFLGESVENIVMPDYEADRLPPYEHDPVHCFCVLVGNTCEDPKVSIAGYCLETEMSGLLLTKGRSNGKNTPHFGDMNVVIGSMNTANKIDVMFALGQERMVDYEGVTVSWNDLQHALKGDVAIVKRVWKD